MRDVRRNPERIEYRIDRPHLIWLSLGAVISMALMFTLGLVLGQRRATSTPAPASEGMARIDADGDMHHQLTFYDRLTAKDAPKDAPAEPKSVAKAAAPVAVAPAAVPASPSPAAAAEEPLRAALERGPAGAGDFTVQVSAFQSYDEAKAYSAQLTRKGFKPFIVAAEIKGKGTWYRVRIGSFPDEQSALSAKGVLAHADIPGWVLRAE